MDRHLGLQEVEASRISRQSAHEGGKVVFTPKNIPLVLISVRGGVDTKGHSAAGRIKLMKNSSDTSGNRTRQLPGCSALPQLTAPLPPINGGGDSELEKI